MESGPFARVHENAGRNGRKRIYWNYHGRFQDAWWENIVVPWRENILKTFEELGSPFLKAAVERRELNIFPK